MEMFGRMESDAERMPRNLHAAKITKGSSLFYEDQYLRRLLQSKFAIGGRRNGREIPQVTPHRSVRPVEVSGSVSPLRLIIG